MAFILLYLFYHADNANIEQYGDAKHFAFFYDIAVEVVDFCWFAAPQTHEAGAFETALFDADNADEGVTAQFVENSVAF